MTHIKRPVTYEVWQNAQSSREGLVKLLLGHPHEAVERGGLPAIVFPPPPYETHGYVERGVTVRIWPDYWVTMSSLGEVRVLNDMEFKVEFMEQ